MQRDFSLSQPRSASSAAQPASDSTAGAAGIWNPGSSASAEQPADDSKYSSAAQPASLCLFARLPPAIWRQLMGLLSYSDVSACSCSTSHEDTKRLLVGYMRRRCCISTFKRLLVHYGAIVWHPDYGDQWDTAWCNNSEHRKNFWRVAIEMIFLYEPKLLQKGQRRDQLLQQDYIHSCGVLFASEVCKAKQSKLNLLFRRCYGAPNHLVQPWCVNSYGLYSVAGMSCLS